MNSDDTEVADGHDVSDTATRTALGPPAMWFRSPDRTLEGWGTARVIHIPAPWPRNVGLVAETLDSMANDVPGDSDSGPIAFGALPFDRTAPASLIVPAVLVHSAPRPPGRVSTTGDRQGTGTRSDGSAAGMADSAPTVTVTATVNDAQWCAGVVRATERIAAGSLRKVVLSRCLDVTSSRPLVPVEIARRLAAALPGGLHYGVGSFVGVSPELLVSRDGDVVRAQPMAGTSPRTGDRDADQASADALSASAKNRAEHQITIDMVHAALLPWCSYLDAEPEPSVVAAGPVQHLATRVEGRLSRPFPSVLELVAALHPTPAVGGWPTAEALALIDELEPGGCRARGPYAGPVGWVDASGDGTWAVGIRGVEIDGATARLRAGVGVVADSDPAAELAETRAKFAATLAAILWV